MAVTWQLTIDCADPARLEAFWTEALGYAPAPVPSGFESWGQWLLAQGVPEEEWDDGAYLHDPDGIGPTISLLRVPEPKTGKNRLHLDLKVSGGRQLPWEQRQPKVLAEVERLSGLGATMLEEYPDHTVMADPEGNEFCVV